MNAGGGWLGAGIAGQYFTNDTRNGTPAFTRSDVRLDFTPNSLGPGGSTDPAYASVGANGAVWSAAWTGELAAKYSEVYTFKGYTESYNSYSLEIGTSLGNETQLIGLGTNQANMTMVAGQTYYVTVAFATNTAGEPWQLQIHWLSTGSQPFAEEAIEPATPVGVNVCGDQVGVDTTSSPTT